MSVDGSLFNQRLARRLLDRGVKAELGIARAKCQDAAWQDYRRAAVLGDRQAQFFLAIHYAAGWDGHKNLRLALAWFKRAALAGEELCTLVSPQRDVPPKELVRLFKDLLSSI